MKLFLKIFFSLILVGASYFCFTIPKKHTTQKETQVTKDFKRITTTDSDGLKNFLEYIGLFCLVITVWQWRNEFKFDSFGFIGGSPLGPTDPSDRGSDDGDIPPTQTTPPVTLTPSQELEDDYRSFQIKEALKFIVEYMQQNPSSLTNLSILSRKLGYSRPTIQRYLFELMKNKIVRKDTYPGKANSVYSLSNSIENLALDYFKDNYVNEQVISDYRYVRLKMKFEIDAIIKTKFTNYIVELKFIKQNNFRVIESGIQQLLKIEEEIDLEPVTLILLAVGDKETLTKMKSFEYFDKPNLKIVTLDIKEITTPNNE